MKCRIITAIHQGSGIPQGTEVEIIESYPQGVVVKIEGRGKFYFPFRQIELVTEGGEDRSTLAVEILSTATTANEVCNGLRLIQLGQMRQMLETLSHSELSQMIERLIQAAKQPLQ